jgi:hypothetical protein
MLKARIMAFTYIRASIKLLLADGMKRTSHNTIEKVIPVIVR